MTRTRISLSTAETACLWRFPDPLFPTDPEAPWLRALTQMSAVTM